MVCDSHFFVLIMQVPFRLTRMLVKAMEVSGIEGNFRSTCENVMQVLRTNKDSVMAMMEAFVHDPLINWRLFTLPDPGPGHTRSTGTGNPDEALSLSNIPSPPQRGVREREILQVCSMTHEKDEPNIGSYRWFTSLNPRNTLN